MSNEDLVVPIHAQDTASEALAQLKTGLSEEQRQRLAEDAAKIGAMFASSLSAKHDEDAEFIARDESAEPLCRAKFMFCVDGVLVPLVLEFAPDWDFELAVQNVQREAGIEHILTARGNVLINFDKLLWAKLV